MVRLLAALTLLLGIWRCAGVDVLELNGGSFDLALQSSSLYLAVLFFDKSQAGRALVEVWEQAAVAVESLPDDAALGKVDGTDAEMKEVIEAYGITVPSIRVFRRSVMGEYRGPSLGGSAQEIADYVSEDAMPSVRLLSSSQEFRRVLSAGDDVETDTAAAAAEGGAAAAAAEGGGGGVAVTSTGASTKGVAVVIGVFSEQDLEEEVSEVYSVSAWQQFQAAADSLRGHSRFFATSSAEVMTTFKLEAKDLPAVYLVSEERNKIVPFSGDILEQSLAEWVLSHSTPSTGELTLASPGGELFATQFFSSRKLKFILFLGPNLASSAAAVQQWRAVAEGFKGRALFSYMLGDAVPDVAPYFDVSLPTDVPVVVAHDPVHDYRYKASVRPVQPQQLAQFVSGVLGGSEPKLLKTESPATAAANKKRLPKSSLVVYATGSNVVDIAGQRGKDVLLMVTSPKCAACRKLAPTLDLLAKAVQGEPRIVVAKIDSAANDLPAGWMQRGQALPLLLWFTAADKEPTAGTGSGAGGSEGGEEGAAAELKEESAGGRLLLTPRSYWDAGTSLQELVSFVQRKGSFDMRSLRVATSEQLGSLLGDEETLRAHYDELDRAERRNEGRVLYDNAALDWLHGEVVFDGKRWHVALAAVLALWALLSGLAVGSGAGAGAGAGAARGGAGAGGGGASPVRAKPKAGTAVTEAATEAASKDKVN